MIHFCRGGRTIQRGRGRRRGIGRGRGRGVSSVDISRMQVAIMQPVEVCGFTRAYKENVVSVGFFFDQEEPEGVELSPGFGAEQHVSI